jgi:hypothetical protein
MPDELVVRDQLNEALFSAVHSGEHGLGTVPKLIKRALQEQVWKERFVRAKRQHFAGFVTFAEYIDAVPPEGLGATVSLVRRLVADDPEASDLLDKALQRKSGRPTETVDNVHDIARPTGNAAATSLRRLRKHRPDIHARVLNGEITPHAGMIEAGLRPRTISIPLDPERAAQYLKRHLSVAERAELIRHLLANSERAA